MIQDVSNQSCYSLSSDTNICLSFSSSHAHTHSSPLHLGTFHITVTLRASNPEHMPTITYVWNNNHVLWWICWFFFEDCKQFSIFIASNVVETALMLRKMYHSLELSLVEVTYNGITANKYYDATRSKSKCLLTTHNWNVDEINGWKQLTRANLHTRRQRRACIDSRTFF